MVNSRRDLTRVLLGYGVGAVSLAGAVTAQEVRASRYPRTESEIRAAVVPADDSFPPGAFRRYGGDPSGVADSTAAINAALQCNLRAFDDAPGPSRYKITGVLRFQNIGQIMSGSGTGDTLAHAGTVLIYMGPAGGKVVSVSNSKTNCSECTVRDLLIDGNSLANIGVEAYDDTVRGGSWRVRLENTAIVNVVHGQHATAVYLGVGGAPNFANDLIMTGGFISSCTRGLWGSGSLYQVENTTFIGCGEAAVYGGSGTIGSSSAWSFDNCVFSSNPVDFDGYHVSQVSFSGCWFENSAVGIYRAANAHSVSFIGCYLHTFCANSMMDFGNAAGYHFFGGNIMPSGTKSTSIANVNPGALGAIFGQPITLRQTNGQLMPLVISPLQQGSTSLRSGFAQLHSGESVSLDLGRGCFVLTLCIWKTSDPSVRVQASFTAFLFDGDGDGVSEIARRNGRGGAPNFSLVCAGNRVTLTSTGADVVTASISGGGAHA